MFSLDPPLGNAELRQIADIFPTCTPKTQTTVAEAMNKDHSEEFYRGVASAYYAASVLLADKNYPETAKAPLLQVALSFVAARLVSGRWPL